MQLRKLIKTMPLDRLEVSAVLAISLFLAGVIFYSVGNSNLPKGLTVWYNYAYARAILEGGSPWNHWFYPQYPSDYPFLYHYFADMLAVTSGLPLLTVFTHLPYLLVLIVPIFYIFSRKFLKREGAVAATILSIFSLGYGSQYIDMENVDSIMSGVELLFHTQVLAIILMLLCFLFLLSSKGRWWLSGLLFAGVIGTQHLTALVTGQVILAYALLSVRRREEFKKSLLTLAFGTVLASPVIWNIYIVSNQFFGGVHKIHPVTLAGWVEQTAYPYEYPVIFGFVFVLATVGVVDFAVSTRLRRWGRGHLFLLAWLAVVFIDGSLIWASNQTILLMPPSRALLFAFPPLSVIAGRYLQSIMVRKPRKMGLLLMALLILPATFPTYWNIEGNRSEVPLVSEPDMEAYRWLSEHAGGKRILMHGYNAQFYSALFGGDLIPRGPVSTLQTAVEEDADSAWALTTSNPLMKALMLNMYNVDYAVVSFNPYLEASLPSMLGDLVYRNQRHAVYIIDKEFVKETIERYSGALTASVEAEDGYGDGAIEIAPGYSGKGYVRIDKLHDEWFVDVMVIEGGRYKLLIRSYDDIQDRSLQVWIDGRQTLTEDQRNWSEHNSNQTRLEVGVETHLEPGTHAIRMKYVGESSLGACIDTVYLWNLDIASYPTIGEKVTGGVGLRRWVPGGTADIDGALYFETLPSLVRAGVPFNFTYTIRNFGKEDLLFTVQILADGYLVNDKPALLEAGEEWSFTEHIAIFNNMLTERLAVRLLNRWWNGSLEIYFRPKVVDALPTPASPLLLTDDNQTDFWSVQSGLVINDDSDMRMVGLNSLEVQVGNLTALNLTSAFIYHAYPSAQDWSSYVSLNFWWYGSASNKTIEVNIDAPNHQNKFQFQFTDTYVGWHRYSFRFDDFSRKGSPDLSTVKLVSIGGADWSNYVYRIDHIILEPAPFIYYPTPPDLG